MSFIYLQNGKQMMWMNLVWKHVLTSRHADQVGRKVAKEKVVAGVLGVAVACVELILALA